MKKASFLIGCALLFLISFEMTYYIFFDHEPYIINLLSFWEDNGKYYITGERLENNTIKTYEITNKMYTDCYKNVKYSIKAYGIHRDKINYFKMKLFYNSK